MEAILTSKAIAYAAGDERLLAAYLEGAKAGWYHAYLERANQQYLLEKEAEKYKNKKKK